MIVARSIRWPSFVATVMLCVVAAACTPASMLQRETVSVVGPNMTRDFTVEIARSDEERQRGLMGRTAMDPNQGMLFLFPEKPERQLQFWMKNTLIPLDILFFDDNGRFVSLATMEPCAADPCALYPSTAPATYALEIAAGGALALGLNNSMTPDERSAWHLQVPEPLRIR